MRIKYPLPGELHQINITSSQKNACFILASNANKQQCLLHIVKNDKLSRRFDYMRESEANILDLCGNVRLVDRLQI